MLVFLHAIIWMKYANKKESRNFPAPLERFSLKQNINHE